MSWAQLISPFSFLPVCSSLHPLLFASPTHDSSLIWILFVVPQSCWAVPCVLLFGTSSFIPGFSSPICLTNVYSSFKTHIKYRCNQVIFFFYKALPSLHYGSDDALLCILLSSQQWHCIPFIVYSSVFTLGKRSFFKGRVYT